MSRDVVILKRGPGHPVTIGVSVSVTGKWQPELLERIDAWAMAQGVVGRSAALRRLVELGLEAKGGKR